MRKAFVASLALILGLLALIAPMGCTATIVEPRNRRDPVTVFVLTDAMTSSLVLPSPGGGLVRYAYGDWRYYALGRNTIANGMAALLWPTQGTLGRAELPAATAPEDVRRLARAEAVYPVRVERGAALRLATRLNAAYEARRGTEVANVPYRMRFVHDDAPYTYFRNSNHAVAAWLREIGCEVRGPTYAARWRVERR
jgi:hypothetical protein